MKPVCCCAVLQFEDDEDEDDFFDNTDDALYDLPIGGECWQGYPGLLLAAAPHLETGAVGPCR
jgi:hypothetical protein